MGVFNGLTKLTELSIVGDEISAIIPGTFQNMSNLERLHLVYKRLEDLDSDVFSGLVNLKYINLAVNKLQYLHPDMFLGLPNIQNVSLRRNSSLQIPIDHPFISSHLDISDCNVHSVSGETFANVSALELLDVSFSNVRSVDINILRALPKLTTLYLHGNWLQCDCQLQEVWRWCQDRIIETANVECDTLSKVNGMGGGVRGRAVLTG